eukprot:1196091-Prorocentrum_minimum.AAC.2
MLSERVGGNQTRSASTSRRWGRARPRGARAIAPRRQAQDDARHPRAGAPRARRPGAGARARAIFVSIQSPPWTLNSPPWTLNSPPWTPKQAQARGERTGK